MRPLSLRNPSTWLEIASAIWSVLRFVGWDGWRKWATS